MESIQLEHRGLLPKVLEYLGTGLLYEAPIAGPKYAIGVKSKERGHQVAVRIYRMTGVMALPRYNLNHRSTRTVIL